jgi:hypothetical protein
MPSPAFTQWRAGVRGIGDAIFLPVAEDLIVAMGRLLQSGDESQGKCRPC